MKSLKIVLCFVLTLCFSDIYAGNAEDATVQKLNKAEFYQKIMNLEKKPAHLEIHR